MVTDWLAKWHHSQEGTLLSMFELRCLESVAACEALLLLPPHQVQDFLRLSVLLLCAHESSAHFTSSNSASSPASLLPLPPHQVRTTLLSRSCW